MKKYRACWIAAGAAVLGFFFAYLSAIAWGSAAWGRDDAMFYLESPVSAAGALEAAERNQEFTERLRQGKEAPIPLEFCLWGQKDGVEVSNENLSRRVPASLILFCGSPELLFEGCRTPLMEDRNGCLIDEKAAWELFGSFQAVGREVSFGNNKFLVRKVVPGEEGLFAIQANGLSREEGGGASSAGLGNIVSRVTVRKPAGYSVRDLESAWMGSHAMPVRVLDLEFLRGIGGFCALLAPFVLCAFFWAYFYCQYRGQETAAGKAVMAGASLALAALLLFFLKDKIRVPDAYIPARWSEFSFWPGLREAKLEAVKLLLRSPKSILDRGWMDCFFRTAGFGVLAAVLTAFSGIMAGNWMKGQDGV